jgi:hypothetical protein
MSARPCSFCLRPVDRSNFRLVPYAFLGGLARFKYHHNVERDPHANSRRGLRLRIVLEDYPLIASTK